MGPLVDTSAIFAALDGTDPSHARAVRVLAAHTSLAAHEFIVVEAVSVIDRRLPAAALTAFFDHILPTIDVSPVGPDLFERAVAAFRARSRRRLSFVDCVTIEFCRAHGIREVFAFDDDLERAGLSLLRA